MKLDSAPVNFSDTSQTENQLEPKDSNESHLATVTLKTVAPVVVDSQRNQESVAVIFGTTFVTIFLAEIGDKTQLSTLLMSAESHSPWVVFLGSAAALITTSLLGVLLGSWIGTKLSPKIVEKSAGVMLLLISLMLFWDILRG